MADTGAVADGHESADDILELATALFQCCDAHGRVFIGWDEAGVYTNPLSMKPRGPLSGGCLRHTSFACEVGDGVDNTLVATEYGVDLNCRFTFNTAAWNTLKQIAELLGVDWRSVPAKVLDTLGKRFVCKTCSSGYTHELFVLDWRACVRTPL